MKQEVYQVTVGGLLHDLGKIIFRAQSLDSRSHPKSGHEAMKEVFLQRNLSEPEILHCIRYHHKKDLSESRLAEGDAAYIVYIADNIASGTDRRSDEEEIEKGFDKSLPFESIYNLMNQNTARRVYLQGDMDRGIPFPKDREEVPDYTATQYNRLYQDLLEGLKNIEYTAQYANSLLALLEGYLTYIPSSTNKQERADISLYDHSKITAAVAACIALYMQSHDRKNYKQEFLKNEKTFLEEPAFLMFSCDLSGIQSFIYTTSGEGALKTLRARSLYLELLLEHIMDEFLEQLGLSRANLIYTGGGHAYALFPNTEEVRSTLEKLTKNLNRWFLQQFANDLYLATAWQSCSGKALMNQAETVDAYSEIFKALSRQLSMKKMSRYTGEDLRFLNEESTQEEFRECKECHRSAMLLEENICSFCDQIKRFATEAVKEDSYFAIIENPIVEKAWLPLPSIKEKTSVFLQVLSEIEVREQLKDHGIHRFYGKNRMSTGQTLATHIWMGDYHVHEDGRMATFEALAQKSQGVKRIGILRADVDNLGQAFVSGLLRKKESHPTKYVTLSRSATLSRSLSMFFKYHLNQILKGLKNSPIEPFSLDGISRSTPRQVHIIYAGGDDLFLVGSWNEIIECAVDIRRAFALYTQKTLSLSAGIGVFSSSYPLIRMAEETGVLEDAAKKLDAEKNAIALFGAELCEEKLMFANCYHWDIFEKQVVGEKLRFLQMHLGTKQEKETTNTAFLYQLLDLLRHANEQINLARFAYHLAR